MRAARSTRIFLCYLLYGSQIIVSFLYRVPLPSPPRCLRKSSPEELTRLSSVDATQASARLVVSQHSPFILARDISGSPDIFLKRRARCMSVDDCYPLPVRIFQVRFYPCYCCGLECLFFGTDTDYIDGEGTLMVARRHCFRCAQS